MENKTVLYQHIKPCGEVFYIGIGSINRAYSKLGRNKFWKRIVNKYNYEVQILESNLSWNEACNKEIELIKQHGRKDLGLGTLCNLTDGGDGTNGRIFTEEHKKKLTLSQTGNKNHRYGKKGVNNGKIRGEHPASKQIIDMITNQIWKCAKDCSEELHIPYDSLIKMLNGNRKNKTNLKYLKN